MAGTQLTPQTLIAYVENRAPQLNVDPAAALAVASQEGLGGQPGDNGTSFGPWQLHAGGALPASVWAQGAGFAQQWAWSTTGVDYALTRIAQVSAGQTGRQAITSIVYQFERPADPAGETGRAISSYPTYSGGPAAVAAATPGVGTQTIGFHIPEIPTPWGTFPVPPSIPGLPSPGSIAGDIFGGLEGVIRDEVSVIGNALWSIVGWLVKRAGLILLGAGLVFVGVNGILRQQGGGISSADVAALAAA